MDVRGPESGGRRAGSTASRNRSRDRSMRAQRSTLRSSRVLIVAGSCFRRPTERFSPRSASRAWLPMSLPRRWRTRDCDPKAGRALSRGGGPFPLRRLAGRGLRPGGRGRFSPSCRAVRCIQRAELFCVAGTQPRDARRARSVCARRRSRPSRDPLRRRLRRARRVPRAPEVARRSPGGRFRDYRRRPAPSARHRRGPPASPRRRHPVHARRHGCGRTRSGASCWRPRVPPHVPVRGSG